MQLFLLPPDCFCDIHVVSQAKETAQILYSALIDAGLPAASFSATVDGELKELKPYARVWNHPCVFWAGSSIHALMWTLMHLTQICHEYQQRYGRRHLCSYHADHLCFHVNKHSDALTSKLGSSRDPADWLAKLTPEQRESVEPRVSTLNAPPEVGYGVACMDEYFRSHVDGQIDLTESYLKFYVYKAKHNFPMKWHKSFDVPKYMQPAFATYYPDKAVVTKRERKRSREDRASGESVESVESVEPA
jgi:hypothetical protein